MKCLFLFFYDSGTPSTSRAVYTPNTTELNQKIAEMRKDSIQFCGVVHTHPPNQDTLSPQDIAYMRKVIEAMPPFVDKLYFPIVLPFQAVIPSTFTGSYSIFDRNCSEAEYTVAYNEIENSANKLIGAKDSSPMTLKEMRQYLANG